jgi:hypothetical protein
MYMHCYAGLPGGALHVGWLLLPLLLPACHYLPAGLPVVLTPDS